VPFPHAVDDHQTTNARFLTAQGGGWCVPQSELTAAALAQRLANLQRSELLEAAEKAYLQRKTSAVDVIVKACQELVA